MSPGEASYVTFSDQYTDTRRAYSYLMPNLLGGSVSFSYTTTNMQCDCVGQISLLAMPGIDKLGQLDQTSESNFACDARGLSGG